jgi:DNA-binding MarR family transcriptional regulator
MENVGAELHKYVWQLLWDFLETHDFIGGHRGELTIIPSVVLIMASGQKISMKDIAATFNVNNSTVTVYVDQLEKKGYITRVRSNEDRRQVFIEVTESGKDWIRRNKNISQEYIDKLLSKLSPEEQKTLVSLITKIVEIDEKSPFIKSFEMD